MFEKISMVTSTTQLARRREASKFGFGQPVDVNRRSLVPRTFLADDSIQRRYT